MSAVVGKLRAAVKSVRVRKDDRFILRVRIACTEPPPRARRRSVYSGYGYFLHFEQHFPSLQSGQHFSAVHLSQHALASFAVAAKGRAISAAAIMAFSMVFMCVL
jgi:hypothetical protein